MEKELRYGHSLLKSDMVGNVGRLCACDFLVEVSTPEQDELNFQTEMLKAEESFKKEGCSEGWSVIGIFRNISAEEFHKNKYKVYRVFKAKDGFWRHDPMNLTEQILYEQKFKYKVIK